MSERNWARIENNKIVNIEVWNQTPNIPNVDYVEITNVSFKPKIDWDYDINTDTYTENEAFIDTRPFLHLVLSEIEINLGESITIDASIRIDSDITSAIITSFNTTYKLTVKNDAGSALRVKMDFVDGVATQLTITPKFSGVYTLTQKDLKDTRINQDIILDVIG